MQTANSARLTAVAAAIAMITMGAGAVELYTGNPDWSVRFDNTVKASLDHQTERADPALAGSFSLLAPSVPQSVFPQALNFNAGDDNFRNRELVSKRVDLLSAFDAVYQKNLGMRVSAAPGRWRDHLDGQPDQVPGRHGTAAGLHVPVEHARRDAAAARASSLHPAATEARSRTDG